MDDSFANTEITDVTDGSAANGIKEIKDGRPFAFTAQTDEQLISDFLQTNDPDKMSDDEISSVMDTVNREVCIDINSACGSQEIENELIIVQCTDEVSVLSADDSQLVSFDVNTSSGAIELELNPIEVPDLEEEPCRSRDARQVEATVSESLLTNVDESSDVEETSKLSRKRIFQYPPNERYPDFCYDETDESEDDDDKSKKVSERQGTKIAKLSHRAYRMPRANFEWCQKYNDFIENQHAEQEKELKGLMQLRSQTAAAADNNGFLFEFIDLSQDENENAEAEIESVADVADVFEVVETVDDDVDDEQIERVENVEGNNNKLCEYTDTEMIELIQTGLLNEQIVTVCGISLNRCDLKTLLYKQWLNDQIINAYMALIMARNNTMPQLPNILAMDTFFYERLKLSRNMPVESLTKNINILEVDLMLVPVNLMEGHWSLFIIDMHANKIQYYDSLSNELNYETSHSIANYLKELHEKLDWPNTKTFEIVFEKTCKQKNTWDCGVYVCMFAEHVARCAPLRFTESSVNEYRTKMLRSILMKKL